MKKLIFMLLLTGSIQGIYAQKAEKKDKFSPNTPLFEAVSYTHLTLPTILRV